MNAVGRIVAVMLAVILIILFPLQYIAQSQGEFIDDAINTYATEFTDTARHQGYITLQMYEDYINKIDNTGEIYDITIEVAHPVSGKEITSRNEIGNILKLSTQQTNVIETRQDRNETKRPTIAMGYLQDNCAEGMCSHESASNMVEDNISLFSTDIKDIEQLVSTNTINSFSTHTHTSNCYAGHNHAVSGCGYHSHSGNTTSGGYCYQNANYHSHSSANGCYSNTSCGGTVSATYYTSGSHYCSTCKKNVPATMYNIRCSGCSYSGGQIGVRSCGHGSGIPSSYTCSQTVNKLTCTTSTTTPISYSLSCSLSTGYNCGYSNDNTPLCATVVTSIIATEPVQTVNQGGNIFTTAIATFLNGTTGTVNCSSNFNSNNLGVQTVTLTYSGLVGNAKTTGTRTCTVEVTVKNPVVLTSITATPNTQVVKRYQSPIFNVTAYYDNNTNKTVSEFTISGYDKALLGTQNITITYSEDGVTKSANASVTVTRLTTNCPICNTIYELDDQDKDNGCPNCESTITGITAIPNNIVVNKGDSLPITVQAIYLNGSKANVTGWTSNYDANIIGIQIVQVSYLGFNTYVTVDVQDEINICIICGREYNLNDDGTDPGCPFCREEIISIEVLEEHVTIEKHQPLPITVIGTFRDGHTEVITDWTSNLIADISGTYDVTIFYQSETAHVIVTIQDDSLIQCSFCGLLYSFPENPYGCPVCSKTVVGIEAYLRNGGTTVMYKSQLNLEIELIFMDTHRQYVYSGWTVEGYQPDVLGIQTVTVHYNGLSTLLTIEVVDVLPGVICPNGHEYYLNEDGTDPGCPYCVSDADKENAIFYFDITYTSDILEKLYTDGIFYLTKGDYITITVTNRDVSTRSNIKRMFFGTNRGISQKRFTYGGEVL